MIYYYLYILILCYESLFEWSVAELREIVILDSTNSRQRSFKFDDLELSNPASLLAQIIEFCTVTTTYKDCHLKLYDASFNISSQVPIEITDELRMEALRLMNSKYHYSFNQKTMGKDYFTSSICQANTAFDNIADGSLISIERVLGHSKKAKTNVEKRWQNFLKQYSKYPQKPYILDKTLCILGIRNITQCSECSVEISSVGMKFNDKYQRCSGSFENNYAPLTVPIGYDRNYNFHYELVGHNDKAKDVADIVITTYNTATCTNLHHLFDSFELLFSFLAFHKNAKLNSQLHYGIALTFLEHEDCNLESPIYDFIQLFLKIIVKIANTFNLSVYVPSTSHILLDPSFVNNLKSYKDVVFPMMIAPVMNNVITTSGTKLLQDSFQNECTAEVCSNEETCQREEPNRIVLIYRQYNRHISNIEDVKKAIKEVLLSKSSKLDVSDEIVAVNLGSLSPCDQIRIARSTKILFYIHGAEGRMISFMQPNSIAIEIYPAGCGISDFNGAHFYPVLAFTASVKYAFFGGTMSSNRFCNTWSNRKLIQAPGCGTFVMIDLFKSFLMKLIPII